MSRLIDEFDGLLFDLDGTVYAGGRAIEHAIEAINDAKLPCIYVTNNASRAPEVVAEQLRGLGIAAASADSVLTSAQAALKLLRESMDAHKLLLLGSQSFRDLAAAEGYTLVDSADEHPDAVVQGHNPDTGWRQLSEAALAVRAGVPYFASNLDTTLPQERGLMVGNGSMVAAVVSATGVKPKSAGKPAPDMLRISAELAQAKRPLVVGDRLDTDIQGGNAAGFKTLQVLTGVHGPRDVIAAPAPQRPDYLAVDLRCLHDSVELISPGADLGFSAEFVDGEVQLQSTPTQISEQPAWHTALLAAAPVCWEHQTVSVKALDEKAKDAISSW